METIKLHNSDLTTTSDKLKGCEGTLYVYGDVLIKVFFDKTKVENKTHKIDLMYKTKIGKIRPINLVEINGSIIGYTMPYLKDYHQFNSNTMTKEEKEIVLRKLKTKLDEFHKEGIIYGDLNNGNVLINHDLDVELCDIDNASIAGLDFDIMGDMGKGYLKKFGICENFDEYMYYLYAASVMHNINPIAILSYMKVFTDEFKKYNENYKEIIKNYINLNRKEFKPLIRL